MSAKKRRLKNGAIPSKNLPNIKATSSGPRATQLCDIEDNKLKEPNNYERAPFKKMLKDGANNSDSLAECRACLQLCSVEEQHNLFKFWDPPWAGMQNTPAEDLSKLACVQISQTDAHSKILCQSCYKHLQNACQFVEIVKKADEVLSLRIGVNPHTPDSWPKPIQVDKNVPYDKVQIKDEIFSDEETQQMNEEDFSNVDVKIEADDWPSQSVHINGIISLGQLNKEMAEINGYLPEVEQNGKTKGLTSEGPITNGVVNSKHDKADSFNTNCLIVRVKEEPVSDAESETNASDLSLDCILCSKTFLSLTGLKAHVIAQHTYKTVRRKTIDDAEDNLLNYVCKICQRRFETSTDLMVHETCHNMCVCYGCNTSFETFDQLSQHRRSCKSLKNSEVGKVLKLEDVQRMANIAQRILEVITKFTIFSQNSEHGNIDECYQALLAVITQKEDSICDDLSSDDDDLYNLSDLESVDDTLLEYNKHFLSDLDLQKKSSKLIESSVMEHNVTSQTDDGFYSMEHSFKAIGKLLSYPVVKITRLQSPILQNYKSSYLYDNQSDTASSYEDFEELDEFLLAEDLLISIDKRADGVEKQMAKEDDNQLSNSEFSTLNTEVDTSKDLLLHSDFNDIHEKSLSSGFLPLNASNSITEEENIAILEFDDDDDDFHSDNVAVCLDILDKYVSTENYENFGKSSSQTSSKVELKSSFALNVANTNLNPVANDEIINLIDESNDIDNLKKPCIVQPISVNINTSIGQIPKKITTGIASSALTLFNINEPRVIQNASITNANLVTTPLGTSGDKTINYMKNIAETSCALKSNIINEQCSSISAVLNKQTETGEMNLSNFYKLHDNETHKIEKHTIKKKAYVRATDVNISENNSKVQTAKLSTSIIVECENDVIGCDNDKEPSSRELPSSVTCDANSQTFEPLSLPRLVGVNNKFIFRYRSTRKIRRGCKMDCKFSCRKIFTSHLRYNKFKDFWKMDLSAQSKFLDDNVVKKVSRKLLPRNRFFLPISNESVRVCRKFIEDTFSILMLSYRKELRKYNMSFDDYYSNVRKKDTKVLDCYKKQTLSKCVSTIHIFKENETNGDGDTKQWDDCVIKKTNNMAQRNYGAEKCCISSIHRDIKTNATSGDTPIVHYSMKNGHKKLVDQTRSEINKHMSEPNLKICSKKSKFERVPTLRKNDSASGASNIKKRYRFNNITINVSTSDKVSFSRSNPYVKLIDVGFYTQLHSLDVPETSSTNSTQTHSQLVQNIDISNLSLVQNVDPSPSYQSDKNNLSCRIDTDLDIPNKDSDSQSILENEVKTNLPHSSFEDFQTSKDINCQSILQEKLKTEMAHPSNENQQISNVTNGRTLLKGEIKTKSLPLVIEEFQASDEKSNNYSTSHNIEGQDPCSFVEDLPKLYVKSNKQPLLNHPKITNYQDNLSNKESENEQSIAVEIKHNEDSSCHSIRQDQIKNHLPHISNENLLKSNDESNGRSNLPLSSYIEITNAFCEDLCDSQINYGDSNSQNIIHALNDDPQTYAEASARPTIEEETSIETLTHPFHADLQICYENDPKIAQAFNRSNTFEHTNTNLQMGNKDIIKQQNVKTNLSHLTITNSLTYNKDNGESNCHSSSNILESQISIHESNYSQMSSKCTVPENTPEIYVEGLFHPESQLLIDAKRNLKQHYQKKSNHFKLQRIIGKGHKFIFRYKVTRSLRPGCQHCTYKCTQVIGFDQRRVLFENFWKMDIHAQTTYLNENVFLINPILGLHDINETRMKRNHKFFFTVYGKRFRVCKKFFLNTLSILMADLKNDSSRLKVMRQRLNPYVKLIDIGFHKEPQPAIEDVSSVSNTSSGETSVSVSWNDSLDSYSELELYSLHTKIELSNQLHNPPKKFMLEAINDNAFQSNSSDSQSQSPVYAQLSTVDQHFDNEIVTNINSSNVEPCDKNTHLMKPHEINSIGPFITNVTQAGNKEQSFKAILNDWSKPQDLDKHKRAPFKCTTNSNQYSNKNCTHTIYMETKSDSFYEIGDKLKNMDICYESSLDSANTSMLDLRQTISVPNFLDCDNHINTVYFDSETYERSDTEEFSKDSQIQNDSALSSLSSAGTNPGVESQTDIQEDKVTDALQLSTQKECAVYELSKNIDSVFIETAQDINNAMNRSERQLDHRERGNTIPTTALTDSLPTFTESINNGSTKLTNSVYVLNKINISSIDQNTSVINIDEERSLDTTEQHTNVIQDNTYLNEQLHPNQASDTSNISMESFKCSNLNIEISNQTYQSSSNTDSLTTETDGVVTPIQDKNNSNNGVTLLSDLDVQNQNYHNTKVNPSSSPEGTSFTYTDFYNSSSEDPESNEMQLINDNRLESDYAQLSNVYEPTRVESYLITKDTYYGTESSCSQFSYDTRSTMNCSKSSLDFYPSFDSQNVIENVECDVPQSFESILNDWAS
ncbi:unnamed protein product [Pieris macdunnoughi]|uniref:Uncharacterized protein n=1 Tax=Pieris macdunnoughi TaxID=345717 RepID=A0A821UW03_9NEOP|nr:unnamed protein product [Pieris macdunnoughi]